MIQRLSELTVDNNNADTGSGASFDDLDEQLRQLEEYEKSVIARQSSQPKPPSNSDNFDMDAPAFNDTPSFTNSNENALMHTQPTNVAVTQPINVAVTQYGNQMAQEDTSQYSAREKPYDCAFDFAGITDDWSGKGNPFNVYSDSQGNIKNVSNFELMRDKFTKALVQHIARAVGGFDAVTSFVVENDKITVNNVPIVPILNMNIAPSAHIVSVIKNAIDNQKYYPLFKFNYLRKFKNLRIIVIDKRDTYFDTFFWSDLGIHFGKEDIRELDLGSIPLKATGNLLKKFPNLNKFLIGGYDWLKQYDAVRIAAKNEADRTAEERQRLAETEAEKTKNAWASRGKAFAGGLAALLGIETSNSDQHPAMKSIGKSALFKSLKYGGLFTGALGLVNLGLVLANPFIVLGSLFATGTYTFLKAKAAKKGGD